MASTLHYLVNKHGPKIPDDIDDAKNEAALREERQIRSAFVTADWEELAQFEDVPVHLCGPIRSQWLQSICMRRHTCASQTVFLRSHARCKRSGLSPSSA